MSLQDKCIKIILDKNIIYKQKIPTLLEKIIEKYEIVITCGNVVAKLKTLEMEREPDEFMGFIEGLQGINFSKFLAVSYTKSTESSYRSGNYYGHFSSIYPLYYLKQEPDFFKWYKFRGRTNHNHDKSGNKAEIFVVYKMKIW